MKISDQRRVEHAPMCQWVVATAAVGLIATAAYGVEVLDQQNDFTTGSGSNTFTGFSEQGQVFTAGTAGTLTRIEVMVYRLDLASFVPATQDAVLTLYDTAGGLPDSELGSVSVPATTVPISTSTSSPVGFVSFDLSAFDIDVTVGQVLAFGLVSEGDDNDGLYWLPVQLGSSAAYVGGHDVFRSYNPFPTPHFDPWQSSSLSTDYGFKTYVDVVPEPAAALMLLVAAPTLLRRRV